MIPCEVQEVVGNRLRRPPAPALTMRYPRCSCEEGGLMQLAKKIIKAIFFLVVLCAVLLLLTYFVSKSNVAVPTPTKE